jgi:hypothetical protein
MTQAGWSTCRFLAGFHGSGKLPIDSINEAARAIGSSDQRIIGRDILPNLITPQSVCCRGARTRPVVETIVTSNPYRKRPGHSGILPGTMTPIGLGQGSS